MTVIVPSSASDFKNDSISEELYSHQKGVSFAAWLARDPKEWNGVEKMNLGS